MADRAPRILLADDEQAIQTLLSYPLQKDGYEVVRASDGREALARFSEQPFDLVVLYAMAGSLIVVHVHVHVKPDGVESFRAASIDNARESVREPGVARFDVVQSTEDPTRFVLVEVYRTPDAPAAHKATAHYARWRDAVADLMAEPRTAVKYVNVAPADADW